LFVVFVLFHFFFIGTHFWSLPIPSENFARRGKKVWKSQSFDGTADCAEIVDKVLNRENEDGGEL